MYLRVKANLLDMTSILENEIWAKLGGEHDSGPLQVCSRDDVYSNVIPTLSRTRLTHVFL